MINQQWFGGVELVKDVTTGWDDAGRATSITETVLPTGETHTLTVNYDDSGRMIVREDETLGRTDITEVDALGRTRKVTDSRNNVVELEYTGLDVSRRVEKLRSDVGGVIETVTVFRRDGHGRVVQETFAAETPDSRVTAYAYDNRGNLVQLTEPGGVVRTRTHDGFGRLELETRGRESTAFVYDAEDNVTRMEDAQGRGVSRVYDGRQRLLSEEYGDGTSRALTYRGDDLVDTVVDRAGNAFTHTYDAGQRLTGVNAAPASGFEGGTQRLTFDYDALDQLSFAQSEGDIVHWVTLERDSRGNVLTETQNGRGVTSAFNAAGERTALRHLGGLGVDVDMTRDALGRASALAAGGSPLVTYGFFGAGRLESSTWSNGTSGKRTFNSAREERSRDWLSPAGQIRTGFTVGRNSAGLITGIAHKHDSARGEALRYSAGEQWLELFARGVTNPLAADVSEQLPTASGVQSFEHDVSGNWSSRTTDGASEEFLSNSLNQYTTAGSQLLTYDRNGNLTSDGLRAFSYDPFGQLIEVTQVGSNAHLASYEYDGLGRMVRRETTEGAESLLYDGVHNVSVLDASGVPVTQFVYNEEFLDHPVMMRRVGVGDFFYQLGPRGSVVAMTDASGAVVERYRYDAYGLPTVLDAAGNPRSSSDFGNQLTFNGRPYDAQTGLVYMRARFYDPLLGRFLQPDPAGFIDGPNLYAFAGNSPANAADPLGLFLAPSERNGQTLAEAAQGLPPTAEQREFIDGSRAGLGRLAESLIPSAGDYAKMVLAPPLYASEESLAFLASLPRVAWDAGSLLYYNERTIAWWNALPARQKGEVIAPVAGMAILAVATRGRGSGSTSTALRQRVLGNLAKSAQGNTGNFARWVDKVSAAQRRRRVLSNLRQNGMVRAARAEALARPSAGSFGAPRELLRGTGARATFQGLEVRGMRDLSHVPESTLKAMADRGFAAKDLRGRSLVLHHHRQNPAGPIVEIPAARHSIGNPRQHPFGNTSGSGLTPAQRDAFNKWRVNYWRARAIGELRRRAL